jgi:hypothetical protein
MRYVSSDRSFRAFLRAIREEPGFGLRLASVGFGSTALAFDEGIETVVIALLAAAVAVVGLAYPYFRRRGRLPGSVR